MDLVNHLADRLLFAVPKKGRLNLAALDLLVGSDIQFRRETRLDIALVKNFPIALIFLPAADIPTFVGEGRVDLGITGQDQVEEYAASKSIEEVEGHGLEEIMELGFGYCKLQVQVPENGGIENPEQLVGKNIVTSFVGLTTKYFLHLEGQQSAAEKVTSETANPEDGNTRTEEKLKTRIMYVGGSVEAACALGVADGIVDLVESGETMRAAGLKPIDTVLETNAVLIKSKQHSNQKLVDLISSRIRGFITAQKYVYCSYNVPKSLLGHLVQITPAKRAPTVTALEEEGWVAVSSMVEKNSIASVMDQLAEAGATDILVFNISNTRA